MSTIAQVLERQQKIEFKQVLVAEDFSGTSERALDYALQIVRRYGSALSIVNAIPPTPARRSPGTRCRLTSNSRRRRQSPQ